MRKSEVESERRHKQQKFDNDGEDKDKYLELYRNGVGTPVVQKLL